MAKQIITKLIDDLDGGEATETVRFNYDGVDYTIDLSAKNAAKLRKALAPYVDSGTKLTPARRRAAADDSTPAGRAEIRGWAWRNGHPNLPSRGRIPAEVVSEYRRRNGYR